MSTLNQYRIAIVAPLPHPFILQEGWMARVVSIDRLLKGVPRIYLHFSTIHRDTQDAFIYHDGERAEVLLHPSGTNSAKLLFRLVEGVDAIYVHTLYLAECLLPWLDPGKVYVDIHGVTPEEEKLAGRPDLSDRYEAFEQAVLQHAKCCIGVSEAMIEYYKNKYPWLETRWLILPVKPLFLPDQEIACRHPTDASRLVALYSGGTQVWQNFDAMLDLVGAIGNEVDFHFLSHEQEVIRQYIVRRALPYESYISFFNKQDLPSAYNAADFGLVLRDDSAVSRVSCPTKLIEYIYFGLVPVVRSPAMGDFFKLGYAYITEQEFLGGFIPDAASRDWMIKHNLDVVRQIEEQFEKGARALLRKHWKTSNRGLSALLNPRHTKAFQKLRFDQMGFSSVSLSTIETYLP